MEQGVRVYIKLAPCGVGLFITVGTFYREYLFRTRALRMEGWGRVSHELLVTTGDSYGYKLRWLIVGP